MPGARRLSPSEVAVAFRSCLWFRRGCQATSCVVAKRVNRSRRDFQCGGQRSRIGLGKGKAPAPELLPAPAWLPPPWWWDRELGEGSQVDWAIVLCAQPMRRVGGEAQGGLGWARHGSVG